MADVVPALDALAKGGDTAELAAALQRELRALAASHLRRERKDHTLQPTALANEAFLRLVAQRVPSYESEQHFLAIASIAIRRVLMEHARAKVAHKRGGGAERVTLFDVPTAPEETPEALVALDAALVRFAEIDPENARIVDLRWFGGLSAEETAEALGVSVRTVERGWRAARAWLRERVEADLAR